MASLRPVMLLLATFAVGFAIPAARGAGSPSAAQVAEAQQSASWAVIENCRIQFADTVSLASERSGVLDEFVPPGQVVAGGASVARLRDHVLASRRAVLAKEAGNDIEIRFAGKSAGLALTKYDRAVEANRDQPGAVTELELRELRLDAERAALQLEQATHTLEVAKLRLAEIDAELESLRLVAPHDVFVRVIHKRRGEFVQAGEVVAEVVNVRRVRVEGFADLDHARLLRIGAAVQLQVGQGPNAKRYPGALSFVDVKIEPVSKRIRFTADIPNEHGQLREGLTGSILLPSSAVVATARRATPDRAGPN